MKNLALIFIATFLALSIQTFCMEPPTDLSSLSCSKVEEALEQLKTPFLENQEKIDPELQEVCINLTKQFENHIDIQNPEHILAVTLAIEILELLQQDTESENVEGIIVETIRKLRKILYSCSENTMQKVSELRLSIVKPNFEIIIESQAQVNASRRRANEILDGKLLPFLEKHGMKLIIAGNIFAIVVNGIALSIHVFNAILWSYLYWRKAQA